MAEQMKPSDVGAAIYELLKADYLKKIPYGNEFVRVVESDPIMSENGIREDHIAFRSFNCYTGEIPSGIESIERIFGSLGWTRGKDKNGNDYRYDIPHMHVVAIHLEFPEDRPDLPKMFVSQVNVDELEEQDAQMIKDDLGNTQDPLTEEDREWLDKLKAGSTIPSDRAQELIDHCVKALDRPWQPPRRSTVLQTDQRSQYVPWTLLNGGLNHIAYLTSDIEATARAHQDAGRELLPKIQGSKEKGLLQTSVRSPIFEFEVTEEGEVKAEGEGLLEFEVREDSGDIGTIRWTGPFAELIERPLAEDGTRRENFLASNAAHIFAATKNKEAK